ncbi:MAG: rhodanese-like domain-containing protein [Desulfuromonadales bacterium]|nr:rhodanese-like domain-containing protein [Desulfuromonadales bacterium]MBN2791609.1 rhodanese-like domain-containing protein [Desulfuromonadales bacterium]
MRSLMLFLSCFVLSTLILPFSVQAKNYRYMSAAEVKGHIEQATPMTLVDIQVEEDFAKHHIIGAVATYAYPVKSAADRAKINPVIAELVTNDNLAIVVCPRGGGGAKLAYDHLVASGITEERVYILTGGQAKWPYAELLDK